MRVLHINLERGWRGGERQTLYLMKGLKEMGCENHLLARKNDVFVRKALANGFRVKVIHKPFLFHGPFLRRFDIVQAHEVRGLQLAAFCKRFHGRPLVFTRRVDNMPSHHFLTHYKYRQVDRLITISERIRSAMVQWGFAPGLITVIHSAINLENRAITARVEALKRRFSGRKVVGCVASLEQRKDHATLLEAAALVNKRRNDVIFALIGDGVLRKELEAKSRELDLDNVTFEGHQEDPYSYYPVLDVFLMTSKSEGLGSAILDAFFYRIPVVATEAGGIPELVVHGKTGLLAPVGSSQAIAAHLLRMLDHKDLRQRCTSQAYTLVERDFSICAMAKAYYDVYRELVEPRP